jgi:hypothetical protein
MIKNYIKLIVAILFVSNVMAQNVPSYVPKNGLVGWWPFNGNANDESGNGNNGTVNGATLTTDRNGKVNSAYSFDGVDDYIDLSDWSIGGEISISAWVKHNAYNHMSRIINLSNGQYLNSIIFANNNNTSSGYITGDCTPTTVTQNLFSLNSWDFFVLKFTSDSICSIYKNGSLFSSFPIVCNIPNVKRLNQFLGKSDFSVDGYFKGELDDIAIYDRTLTDQEIKQLYTNCIKETATSSSFNSVVYTTNTPINLTATPTGGTFSGEAVTNNEFNPSKAKLGINQVKYTFKNSTGCADSTNFEMILVDTLGNKCSTYDTLKIKVQLTTGIKAGQIASMNVYPNPTSDVVIIEASDVAELNGYSYKMVDLQGKQVYKELVTKSKTEISLKTIGAKGVYILHVVDAQGVSIENKKIVLE